MTEAMEALYIIGEPGVGKSTLVDQLTAGAPYEEADSPFAFRRYDCGVWELGARRKEFSGTDALGMSVQPKVVEFLQGMRPKYLLAEGDRLANRKFFAALVALGYRLTVAWLDGPEIAEMQRSLRGSNQDATWLKGRQTKVRKLGEGDPSWYTIRLHAGPAPAALVNTLTMHTPVAALLRQSAVGVTA